MDRETAKNVADILIRQGQELDQSVKFVQDNCSGEEFEQYRRTVGRIMGIMLLDILNPIFEEHPELKPEELKWTK